MSARCESPNPIKAREFVTKVKSSRSSRARRLPVPAPSKGFKTMADKNKLKQVRLQRRKWSVRSSVFGTAERPRLSVFRSDKHIYAQVIDDHAGRTLAAAASNRTEVRRGD